MIRVCCSPKTVMSLSLDAKPCPEELPSMDRWCMCIKDDPYSDYQVLLVMNSESRFGFYIWDIMHVPTEELPRLLLERMQMALSYYGLRKENMDPYFSEGLEICLGMDRSETARIGSMANGLSYARPRKGRERQAFLTQVRDINRRPVYPRTKDEFLTWDWMLGGLAQRYQMMACCHPAYELEASLLVKGTEVSTR